MGLSTPGLCREHADRLRGPVLVKCSDSVTSVNVPGGSPMEGREPMVLGSPVHDDSQPMLVDHRSSDSRSINGRSPHGDDIFFSPGSSEPHDSMLIDTAHQPEKQARMPAVLSNGMGQGAHLPVSSSVGSYFMSEGGALHGLLNRTDSANHAADLEALQQVHFAGDSIVLGSATEHEHLVRGP